MAQIRDDTRPAPAVANMTVTQSLILDARDPVVFANTARGHGRQRVVFETPHELATGTTVVVVATVAPDRPVPHPELTTHPAPPGPAPFTLFIDPDRLRMVHDTGDSAGTHTFPITHHGAPGDCHLTAEQLEALVRRAASMLGLRVSKAPGQ